MPQNDTLLSESDLVHEKCVTRWSRRFLRIQGDLSLSVVRNCRVFSVIWEHLATKHCCSCNEQPRGRQYEQLSCAKHEQLLNE